MTTFFTSDTHFGHARIIEYCKRPFASVEEMNEKMIASWNERVKPGDTVYHTGDFSLGPPDYVLGIKRRLRGNVHLIQGNHDRFLKKALDYKFAWTGHYKEIKVDDQKIVMMHYALLTWNKMHRGSWMLHGHSHGSLPRDPHMRRIDVGVDCWGYKPVAYEELVMEMNKVDFKPVDHHEEL